MRKKAILSGIVFFVICNKIKTQTQDTAGLFVSSVFTPINSFTDGAEGPAVDKEGRLYAVNYHHQGTIGKIGPSGIAEIFVELPRGSTGNGIRFNSGGDMFVADYTGHNILKVDMRTRQISIFAHDGRMKQPNDIAITKQNTFFASDPDWENNAGAIWYVNKKGKAVLLESGMGTTNGIEVNPANNKLYVNESIQRRVWVYDISKSGKAKNKRLLIECPDFGLDGMRCDQKGNLYIARYGKGVVAIVSPEGRLLREVGLIGQKPTNVAFGGDDGKTVYVTLQDTRNIESFRSDIPGREWTVRKRQ